MLAFCLHEVHEVQGDWFADEPEYLPLRGGGLGELVEARTGASDVAGAAGKGLQVLKEAL